MRMAIGRLLERLSPIVWPQSLVKRHAIALAAAGYPVWRSDNRCQPGTVDVDTADITAYYCCSGKG